MPSNKVITVEMEKIISERDFLKREVTRLEDEVSRLAKSKHDSDQLCYHLLNEKDKLISAYSELEHHYQSTKNDLTTIETALSHLQPCSKVNGKECCGQPHPDLMEMLRSNSDSFLSSSSSSNKTGCQSSGDCLTNRLKSVTFVSSSTQTDWTWGLDSFILPPPVGFPGWNYEGYPPPPQHVNGSSGSMLPNPPPPSIGETVPGLNHILLEQAYIQALAQVSVDSDDDSDDDDEDDEDDDDDLQECDAIEYEEISLHRNSANQSLGLCLSSDPPGHGDLLHQVKGNHTLGNASSSSSSSAVATAAAAFDHQGAGQVHSNFEKDQTGHNILISENRDHSLSTSFNSNNNQRNEVYISHLESGSLADRSGSIKVGDQLLEINGCEVSNLDEAQNFLLRRDVNSFEILIGRPNVHHDHIKCRERSLAKRLTVFDSSGGESNHVSIVDCSQEFFILSMENKQNNVNNNSNSIGKPDVTSNLTGTGKGISNNVYEAYIGTNKTLDEKDSGMGKTDGDSTCSRTNDTCSTDHELSDKASGQPGVRCSSGQANRSSESSLEKKRALLNREMANIQAQCEKLNQQVTDELSKTSGSGDGGGDQGNRLVSGNQTCQYEDECHYASTQIVSTPPNTPRNLCKPESKPSPPEVKPKPVKTIKQQSTKSGADLLPEMQPQEKKESIKRWIKSGLPTTPPNIMSNIVSNNGNVRPSSFKPGLPLRTPLDAKPFDMESRPCCPQSEYRKEIKNVIMEEKGTQIESDAASLMSCESCRACCRASVSLEDKRLETFQPYPHSYQRLSEPIGGTVNNSDILPKRYTNLPIPVKVPIVPIIPLNATVAGHGKSSRQNNEVSKEEKENIYSSVGPSATMYTTKANLEHTILLQQEMFRQALLSQSTKGKPWKQKTRDLVSSVESRQSHRTSQELDNSQDLGMIKSPSVIPLSPLKAFGPLNSSSSLVKIKEKVMSSVEKQDGEASSGGGNGINMEWKIKKRPDGTRYITRRPIRNKILKERAQQINQERSGLTTDDDTMSELKVGRYWSKIDRKKHSEKAKDRKRKEMLLRAMKMSSLKEQSEEREQSTGNTIKVIELNYGNGGGGNHSSSGSGGSMVKNRSGGLLTSTGTIKGNQHGNQYGNLIVDSSLHGKQLSGNSGVGHQGKLNGPSNGITSKNQINELLTVTTV